MDGNSTLLSCPEIQENYGSEYKEHGGEGSLHKEAQSADAYHQKRFHV